MQVTGILQGDCMEVLKTLPDGFVDCCVTSPPYYGLRDYGTGVWIGGKKDCPHRRMSKYSEKTATGHHQEELAGNVGDAIYKKVCPICGAIREDKQLGLEKTPEQYIERLVGVFREVKRVLKDDGTLWVNIGDTYNCAKEGNTEVIKHKSVSETNHFKKELWRGAKQKDMIGIPWMLAFALRDDGWYLRQDIIWHKPNPMPEPVKDRCVKGHEYIFLLSKKPRYYFDFEAIQEDAVSTDDNERRNKRDVWSVSSKPVREAHFATFPEALIEPCILAGSRKGGIVLDPFFGSGTTGRVATKYGRRYLGIELNPEYITIAGKRNADVQMDLLAYL